MMQLRDKLENAMILNKHDSSMYLAFEITINVINNEMLETEKNQLETAYWAGRLIGYDQSWEVAEEVVDAIKLIRNEAIASHVARIKELKSRIKTSEILSANRIKTQPNIKMITACGMFVVNTQLSSATICKNCGKEKYLHVTPQPK